MKRWMWIVLMVLLCPVTAQAVELDIDAPSVLLMEKETGAVLYAKGETDRREPAASPR